MNFPLRYGVYEVLPELKGRVLQVGCGTGALNIYLRKKNKDKHVELINLDINEDYAELGRKRGAFSEFVLGDICKAPFEDESFDGILFARSLHHIKHQKKAFSECARLLKKGGVMIISDHLSLSRNEPSRSYMMNSYIDGNIWRYSKEGFRYHLEKYSPPELNIKEFNVLRAECITNYNFLFPNADVVAILEKK